MRLLVTGAAGFIGSHFVRTLLDGDRAVRVVGLDKLTYAGAQENLAELSPRHGGRFELVRGDVSDRGLLAKLFAAHDFDALVHFAAETHVDRSIVDACDFLSTNVLGTHALLDAAKSAWSDSEAWRPGCKFVQISTDEVYGALGPSGDFTEHSPLSPRNPYSASKAAADHLVMAYHHTYGLPICIGRPCNNYGPHQSAEKLIPLMIRNALNHEPLPVYGDGLHVRDWLYVEDNCRAIERVLLSGAPGRVYNIGGNNERNNLDLVRTIIGILSRLSGDAAVDERLIRHVTDRPGHDRRYALDASRICAELGWKPEVDLDSGLERTVRWYLTHREWLERSARAAQNTDRE